MTAPFAPASSPLAAATRPQGPDVLSLLLRHGSEADRLCADRDAAAALLPRLVLLSLGVLALYGAVHGVLVSSAGPDLWSPRLAELGPARVGAITAVAYAGGLFGAKLAALPSFYFYGLLAGVRTHPWRIAVESMRSQATASAVLLGLLPVYLAAGAGLVLWGGTELDGLRVVVIGLLGYALPFVAGLAGVGHLYRVFRGLVSDVARTSPDASDGRRPAPLLLVMAWSALYTALAPVGVARIFTALVQ